MPKVYNVNIRKYNQISISAGGCSSQNLKAASKIHLTNTKDVVLGIPLPKGVVRAFKEDLEDRSLEFIGEDQIQHIANNQNIIITIGNAFDITANLYSSNRRSRDQGPTEAYMNLTIINHKNDTTQIQVIVTNYYGSNLNFQWKTNITTLERSTASFYKWKRVYQPHQTFVFQWQQEYNL